nr:rhodanese domain-containing protein CG4456-like [Aedes albopictus]
MASLILISLSGLLITGPLTCLGDEDPCSVNPFNKTCIADNLRATYEEVISLKYKFDVLLIDVRQPEEVACTGSIPTSIHIPLATVSDELQLPTNAFLCKYGRRKPGLDDLIIFYCRSGNRAATAALAAVQLGFRKVKNYVGSWIEYATRRCLILDCSGATPDYCNEIEILYS